MATEAALQLDVAPVEGGGAEAHFSNFPGLWQPGRPIAIAELGFASAADAVAAVDELGLPLVLVDVEAGSAPMPARDNHVANEEQARAIDLAASASGFKTHTDLDAAATAAGVEWPSAKMTVAAKTAFLQSFEAGTADEDGTAGGEG